MTSKRNYIEEIIAKKGRLHKRGSRNDLFARRVYPLVQGFRSIKSLKRDVPFRDEWLKYGAIGYVASVEGYFRLLLANLIDHGEPYLSRVTDLRDIRFSAESVIAIHTRKVSLGEFVAHLLPLNGVADINAHMSALLGEEFLAHYSADPISEFNRLPIGQLLPNLVAHVEQLFKLRHLYAHELATRERVPVRRIEQYIGSTAMFVWHTEELATQKWLPNA